MKPRSAILRNTDPIAFIDDRMLGHLKQQALAAPHGRARLCLHADDAAPLHEMILAVTGRVAFPVHRHRAKTETFAMLEGRMAVMIFDDAGAVAATRILSPAGQGDACLFRMAVDAWHGVLPLSDMVVYLETTQGPFRPQDTEYAPFCPTEEEGLGRFLRRAAGLDPQ